MVNNTFIPDPGDYVPEAPPETFMTAQLLFEVKSDSEKDTFIRIYKSYDDRSITVVKKKRGQPELKVLYSEK